MSQSQSTVLVVGAGPSGLTTALELVRQGCHVTIIDKRPNPSGLSRAVGILPTAMAVFAKSGVDQAIASEAVPIRTARVHIDKEFIASLSISPGPDAAEDKQCILGLPQDRTEAILRNALQQRDCSVKYGQRLVDIKQRENKVSAKVATGFEVKVSEYDYIVGADGIKSTVRELMGISFDGYDLPEPWSIADVESASWSWRQHFSIFLRTDGRVVIVVPLEAGRFRLVSNTDEALATLPVPLEVDKLRRQSIFVISVRQARQYVSGRIALVGDSAHAHSPVGGRGMNLGIADAGVLAQCLVEGRLSDYHRQRHVEGRRIIAFTERARRMVTSKKAVTRSAVKVFIRFLSKSRMLQKLIADRIVEL